MGYVKSGLQGKVPVTSMMQKNSHLNNITNSDFNRPLDIEKTYESKQTHYRKEIQVMDHMSEYERIANDVTNDVAHTRNFMHRMSRDPKTYTISDDIRFDTQAPVSMLPLSRQKRDNTGVMENIKIKESKPLLETEEKFDNFVQDKTYSTVTTVPIYQNRSDTTVNIQKVFKNPMDAITQQFPTSHMTQSTVTSDVHLHDNKTKSSVTTNVSNINTDNMKSKVSINLDSSNKNQYLVHHQEEKQFNYGYGHHTRELKDTTPAGLRAHAQHDSTETHLMQNHNIVRNLPIAIGGNAQTTRRLQSIKMTGNEKLHQHIDKIKADVKTYQQGESHAQTLGDSTIQLHEAKPDIVIHTQKQRFVPIRTKQTDVEDVMPYMKDHFYHSIETTQSTNKQPSVQTMNPNQSFTTDKIHSVALNTNESHLIRSLSLGHDNQYRNDNKQVLHAFVHTDTNDRINSNHSNMYSMNSSHMAKDMQKVNATTHKTFSELGTNSYSNVTNSNAMKLKDKTDIEYVNDKRTMIGDTRTSKVKMRETTPVVSFKSRGYIDKMQ